MELEDHLIFEDDFDIIDIINSGFPRRRYERADHFHTMDDMSFFRRFRLTKPVVFRVLEEIEGVLEFPNDLNNSLTPVAQLLLALRFYASAGHQVSIGDFVGAHQTTVSRVLYKVSNAIADLCPRYIKLPSAEQIFHVQNDFYQIARFPRVIGCLDGTPIRIQSPGGEDAEIFRNRKSYFSVNTQIVCDSHLKILDVVANWPGSTHDVTIFNSSRLKARCENREFNNAYLLGDSGYTLRPYLLTPLLNPLTRAERLYNEAQIRTRNCVERCIGVWKRRFPVLAYGLRCKLETTLSIIVATAVLHNIAVEMNEEVPPPPDNINVEELDYLIEQGNIPPVQHQIHGPNNHYDYRQILINNYFANLYNVKNHIDVHNYKNFNEWKS